ncbi:MAG TPA: DUF6676 family protein [Gaiellaceae bacterium]|nr:DUF6676 family protein [Gaiellaceae bacterium]
MPVSYEPGAAVSEVEAGGFPSIVGDNARVAFMPESAAGELAGAPSAIAEEIAREAKLDGTLVVLVGSSLGAWSSDISAERLDVLVREAQGMGGSAVARTETLVRNVQAEPAGRERGGVAFVAVVGVLALAGLVALARHRRRRHRVGA